jgi:hypothetical protein
MTGFTIWDLRFGIYDLGFTIWDLRFGSGPSKSEIENRKSEIVNRKSSAKRAG